MRRVDKLGRIVIPLEMRQKYGLTEGKEIDFLDSGDGITVKSSDSLCKLCQSPVSADSKLPLCERCIGEILRLHNEKA